MGEAEDIVARELRDKAEAEYASQRVQHQRLYDEVMALIPAAIRNLRRNDYPDIKCRNGHYESTRTFRDWNGEPKRLAWRLGCPEDTYNGELCLLADGTLIWSDSGRVQAFGPPFQDILLERGIGFLTCARVTLQAIRDYNHGTITFDSAPAVRPWWKFWK